MSSLRTIGTVAVNVFRESVRDKVLYNLVLFAVLMIGTSYLLGQLTAGQDVHGPTRGLVGRRRVNVW